MHIELCGTTSNFYSFCVFLPDILAVFLYLDLTESTEERRKVLLNDGIRRSYFLLHCSSFCIYVLLLAIRYSLPGRVTSSRQPQDSNSRRAFCHPIRCPRTSSSTLQQKLHLITLKLQKEECSPVMGSEWKTVLPNKGYLKQEQILCRLLTRQCRLHILFDITYTDLV